MTRGLVAALMGLPAVLQAQAAPAPGYRAGAACVAYAERADARVLSTVGGTVHEGGTGRAGVLVVRLRPGGTALAAEAWYDSLAVWEVSAGGARPVDATGLVGGRWRGALDVTGQWTPAATPFIPDGVRAVMDLGPVVPGFFPPLPGGALPPGGRASRGPVVATRSADGDSLSLRRVLSRTDTLEGGQVARTSGDETWTVHWPGGAPMPVGWNRVLAVVTRMPAPAGGTVEVDVRRETVVEARDPPPACR